MCNFKQTQGMHQFCVELFLWEPWGLCQLSDRITSLHGPDRRSFWSLGHTQPFATEDLPIWKGQKSRYCYQESSKKYVSLHLSCKRQCVIKATGKRKLEKPFTHHLFTFYRVCATPTCHCPGEVKHVFTQPKPWQLAKITEIFWRSSAVNCFADIAGCGSANGQLTNTLQWKRMNGAMVSTIQSERVFAFYVRCMCRKNEL